MANSMVTYLFAVINKEQKQPNPTLARVQAKSEEEARMLFSENYLVFFAGKIIPRRLDLPLASDISNAADYLESNTCLGEAIMDRAASENCSTVLYGLIGIACDLNNQAKKFIIQSGRPS